MDEDKKIPEFGWEITIDFLGNPTNQLRLVCMDENEYYYKWCVLAEIVCGMIRDEGIFKIIRKKGNTTPEGVQYLNPAAIEKVTIVEIDKIYKQTRKGLNNNG